MAWQKMATTFQRSVAFFVTIWWPSWKFQVPTHPEDTMGRSMEAKPPKTKQAPRRTWARGTVEQRGVKTWVVRLGGRIDPATGKRVRESRRVHASRRD
jgi:hypothetical protein